MDNNQNLTIEEAISAVYAGFKVKLPEWGGYWYADAGEIKVFTKCGKIVSTPWYDKYKDRTDWQIID